MDVTSSVGSLFSLALFLKTWLDQRKERDSTIEAISLHVSRICAILAPFQEGTDKLDPTIQEGFFAIGDVLARTKEHLLVWGRRPNKRTYTFDSVMDFLDPASVTKKLKEDEHQLSQQLMLMLLSIAVAGYFQDRAPMPDKDQNAFVSGNVEVREFWQKYIGARVFWVNSDTLLQALQHWVGRYLDEKTLKTLLFRLDEFDTGRITLSNLETSVGSGSLKELINMYDGARFGSQNFWDPTAPEFKLIVWVDDNPSNNQYEVDFAQSHNVKVVQLGSTALAKAWIEDHQDLLRQNDIASRMRFISDNTRFEDGPSENPSAGPFINLSAGHNLVRYLRGRLFRAPILVYTGSSSVAQTHYVLSYEMAGSTTNMTIVLNYILSLAEGRDDDDGWKGFRVYS